jgi:hypothetical protein
MTNREFGTETILAVDVGSVNTRALLFDVVGESYCFLGMGMAPSTAGAPYMDINEGIHQAMEKLQETTSRVILSREGQAIMPSADNVGFDRLVATFSVGNDIRVVATGLLNDVSLESAQRLISTNYAQIFEMVGLGDRRRTDAQIDAILAVNPDLFLITGGTDDGATRSVLRNVELVANVCRLLPAGKKPHILYAGNKALTFRIKEYLDKLSTFQSAENVRPSIDFQDISPASEILAQTIADIRASQIGGFEQLALTVNAPLTPTVHAFSRIIRFLSKMYGNNKGVLGIDLGASHTTVASGLGNTLLQTVYPIGVGQHAPQVLLSNGLEQIMNWLSVELSPSVVRDAIWQKSLFPANIPQTKEELAVEHALVKQILRMVMAQTRSRWPEMPGLYEPVIASGLALNTVSRPGQTLLMLLDGLQPSGVTTFLYDSAGVVAALGVIARINTLLPVQVLESKALLNLGTVITANSDAPAGTPILKAILRKDGSESPEKLELNIRAGTLSKLPVPPDQKMILQLVPLRKVDIEGYTRRGINSIRVIGGACGAIIDTRGRPLQLPTDHGKRRSLLHKWEESL